MNELVNRRVINFESSEFKKIWKIYIEAFPEDERRFIEAQRELISNNPNYKFEGIFTAQNNIVGLLFWWSFKDLRFIEHYAIDSKYRNSGIGKKALLQFLDENETPILLELEKPSYKNAIRRIEFYKRLGFKLNDIEYTQPSYRENIEDNLFILASYPTKLNESLINRFENKYVDIIYNSSK